MTRYFLMLFNSLLLAVSSTSNACGPDGCGGVEYTLSAPACGLAALPFLAPQNDSRLNMAMLIADQSQYVMAPWQLESNANGTGYGSFFEAMSGKQPLIANRYEASSSEPLSMPSSFSVMGLTNEQWLEVVNYDGSYSNSTCQSNSSQAVIAFINALQAAGLPKQETTLLVNARLTLIGHCGTDMPPLPILPKQSIASEFGLYLKAIHAFYSGNTSGADLLFQQINNANNAWVA